MTEKALTKQPLKFQTKKDFHSKSNSLTRRALDDGISAWYMQQYAEGVGLVWQGKVKDSKKTDIQARIVPGLFT